jgi:hypothetical protein
MRMTFQPMHALEPVGDGLLAAVGERDIPGRADLAAPLDVAVADGELALQAVLEHEHLADEEERHPLDEVAVDGQVGDDHERTWIFNL